MTLATHYQIDANGKLYTVVDAAQTVYWAVLTGAVTDAALGAFDVFGFSVRVGQPGFGVKAFADGAYAITAYPDQVFPNHAFSSYPLSYVLAAPGFHDFAISVPIPAGASFPIAAPPVALRRLPVRVQGRVVNRTSRAPISGATVTSVDGPTPPPVHVSALRSTLNFEHSPGTPTQAVSIAVIGSAALITSVRGGDTVIGLSSRAGLAANSIVRLQDSARVHLEYGVVDHVGPGPSAAAGQVFLRGALRYSHGIATTAVDFVSATPTGAPATLAAPVEGGDGILLSSQRFVGTVGIDIGSPLAEFREVGAISDSDGFYGFDGITGLRQMFLQATQGALQQTAAWFVEYDRPINLLDFLL